MVRVLLSLFLTFVTTCVSAAQTTPQPTNQALATFAGGCFWCTEADFDKVPGVLSTTSGYIGGKIGNPTYEQVSAGGRGNAEAGEIFSDPGRVPLEHSLS